MPTPETIRRLREVRTSLADSSLTEHQAKLYSQRLLRDMGRPGLDSFTQADVTRSLEEATWLLQSALIERAAEPNGDWRRGAKRSAEVLEFLTQPELRPAGAPIHFLAAGAY